MRKKYFLMSLLILLVILVLGIPTRPAAQVQGVGHEDVLIGFKKFPGKSEKALVERAGGKIKYTYHLIPVIAASVPSVAIKGLRHNPNVTYVEEDSDIFLDGEWTVDELADSWGVNRIDAELAWNKGNKGAGVHVAIIDTGIDMDHPDLFANIAGGVNFVPGKGKGSSVASNAWDDDNGHGTHCAGIVAADDNGFGVVGVAPDARLYGVKVLDNRGRGKASDFIAGLQWSVDNGANVISMSLRMSGEGVEDACNAAYAAGLLLVKSAGNNWGRGVTFPAHLDSVLAVSAIDEYDNIAEFSSVGPDIELTAPGVNVYSTYKNGAYHFMDGTSMACPHVSGVAALVWATGDYVSPSGVRLQLHRTAEPLGASPPPNDQYGYGVVNAAAALDSPVPGILFLLSRDKSEYNINETAALTAVVSDQDGNPISNLLPTAFVTTLYKEELYPGSPITDRNVTFLPITPAGTYIGYLSFSGLETYPNYSAIRYKAVVEVTDTARSLSEIDDVTFLVVDPSGMLSVIIEPDKAPPVYYTIGDTIYVRVTVLDADDNIVAGADVHVELNNAVGRYYLRDETTDVEGVAKFRFKTKPPDGIGTYLIRVWASKSGGPTILDDMEIWVQ
jgi:subtilisin family serine protease